MQHGEEIALQLVHRLPPDQDHRDFWACEVLYTETEQKRKHSPAYDMCGSKQEYVTVSGENQINCLDLV